MVKKPVGNTEESDIAFAFAVALAVCERIITARNEVWGKVIFLHLSVILFTEGGVPGQVPPLAGTPPRQVHPLGRYTSWTGTPWQVHTPRQVHPLGRYPRQIHPLGQGTPPGRYTPWQVHPIRSSACWEIQATSGRYASYWNAFLLVLYLIRNVGRF